MKLKLLVIVTIFCMAVFYAAADGDDNPKGCAEDCHIIKPYDESAKDKKLLVYKHFQAEIGCTDCHEQTEEIRKNEEEWYKKGEYEEPMFSREFETDFCFRCHDSYKELAKRTAHLEEEWGRNPHESHLGEPGCYTCHWVHKTSEFACSECHTAKWEERLPEGWIPK